MNILGFSAGYSVEEDRLLLMVRGDQGSHEYWLTRKATLMLAEAIRRILGRQYEIIGGQIATQHNRALAEFGHQAAAQTFPVQSGAEQRAAPVNATLLYAIEYAAEDQDRGRLAFKTRTETVCHYLLSRYVMHAMLNLLQSQAMQAGWGLDLLGFEMCSSNTAQDDQSLVIH